MRLALNPSSAELRAVDDTGLPERPVRGREEKAKMDPREPIDGRGTKNNPENRFERIHLELEAPETEQEEVAPEPTLFYRDASRGVLAENDSPDVGFRFSINPYRGCEHGCIYCVGPDTPVLSADMTWRPIGQVRVGDVLVGFDEFPEAGRTRKL